MKFCDLIGQLVDYISHNMHVDLVCIPVHVCIAGLCVWSCLIGHKIIVKSSLLPTLVIISLYTYAQQGCVFGHVLSVIKPLWYPLCYLPL